MSLQGGGFLFGHMALSRALGVYMGGGVQERGGVPKGKSMSLLVHSGMFILTTANIRGERAFFKKIIYNNIINYNYCNHILR